MLSKAKNAIVVMGVSGCEKSTVGKALAEALKWEFFDADDFHPAANIDKMESGISLNDKDRKPWLEDLASLIESKRKSGIVLACSALKQSYRSILNRNNSLRTFVCLEGSFELISNRMQARKHFMPSSLLKSQFDTLETPSFAIHVSIDQSPARILEQIIPEIT